MIVTARSQSTQAPQSERGFVIVAVLWIIAALSSLAVIFSVYLSNSATALATNDTALQTEALVSSSLELTAYRLSQSGGDARPAKGSFQYRLSDANVFVSFTSEAARIDLNTAPKEFLANLFVVLGADQAKASDYADRLVAWRTKPAAGQADEEEALYRAAGLSYSPRQAPFAHVDELALVVGLPRELVERALHYVTVFNGSPSVDVLIAAPEVIAALPGMTASGLNSFLNERPNLPRDGGAIDAALGPAKTEAAVQDSRSFRVVTTISFANGRRTATEAIIALGGKDDPYRVLSWQDDLPLSNNPRVPERG
jgi:general secretion pathway protein K